MTARKVLVTGAAGGIGTVLLPAIVNTSYVVAFDDLSSGRWSDVHDHPRIQKIEGSIQSSDDLSQVPWYDIDAVIHLAAVSSLPACQASPALAFQTNLVGTVLLADFARRFGITPFINASTSAIYEGTAEPFLESRPVKPHLVYSQSKYFAELVLAGLWRDYSFPSVNLRLFNVFGPYQDFRRTSPPLVNYVVREALNERSPILHSDGQQRRDYIYVGDVVNAICAVLSSNYREFGCFNICSGTSFSVAEIVQIISSVLGLEIEPVYRDPSLLWDMYPELSEGQFPLAGQVVHDETTKSSLGASSLFSERFSWTPRSDVIACLSDVVLQTAEYIRKSDHA